MSRRTLLRVRLPYQTPIHNQRHETISTKSPQQAEHRENEPLSLISSALDPSQIDTLLQISTWSPTTLFHTTPQASQNSPTDSSINPPKLRHLLRLCALPAPQDTAVEQEMLADLRAQLHFVREVQRLNTEGVEPLRSLRDETDENVVGLERMREALDKEVVVGKWRKRRRRGAAEEKGEGGKVGNESWDPLGQAARRVGRYFVVEEGKS